MDPSSQKRAGNGAAGRLVVIAGAGDVGGRLASRRVAVGDDVIALRRRDRFALFALLAALLPPATFGITIFGDGLADVAKQGHLIFNTTLAFACTAAVLGTCALARRAQRVPLALDRVDTVQFDQKLGAANVAEQDQPLRRVG